MTKSRLSELSLYERETLFNYNQEEKQASIQTNDPKLIKQLDRLCERFSDFKFIRKDVWEGKFYEIPKQYITVRAPKILSIETKLKMSNQMKALRQSQLSA